MRILFFGLTILNEKLPLISVTPAATIIVVYLDNVHHHQRFEVVPNLTANNIASLHLRTCIDAEAGQ
jgi:hypothetical protein